MQRNIIATIIAALVITGAMVLSPETGNAREQYRGKGWGTCGEGRGKPFGHLDRMQYFLDLSDAQVEKIFKIDQEYREKYFKNRNSYETVEKLREDHRKAVQDVLTDKQKERYKETKDLRWRNFKNQRSGYCPRGY
ncbi:MAG TPA: hypothetical protein PK341_10710 [Spirochaetota bacterium]|nr:hypothetical protein [Spirochaetota bacterium]